MNSGSAWQERLSRRSGEAPNVVRSRGVRLNQSSRREPMELRWPMWIGVVVDDLEKQRRFYRDALGFRETGSSEGWVHLEFPGGGLFELIQRDPSPQYEAKRYQVGFTVEDLQATREELIRRGVEPISEIEGKEWGPATCGATSAMPRTTSSRSRSGSKLSTSSRAACPSVWLVLKSPVGSSRSVMRERASGAPGSL